MGNGQRAVAGSKYLTPPARSQVKSGWSDHAVRRSFRFANKPIILCALFALRVGVIFVGLFILSVLFWQADLSTVHSLESARPHDQLFVNSAEKITPRTSKARLNTLCFDHWLAVVSNDL